MSVHGDDFRYRAEGNKSDATQTQNASAHYLGQITTNSQPARETSSAPRAGAPLL